MKRGFLPENAFYLCNMLKLHGEKMFMFVSFTNRLFLLQNDIIML